MLKQAAILVLPISILLYFVVPKPEPTPQPTAAAAVEPGPAEKAVPHDAISDTSDPENDAWSAEDDDDSEEEFAFGEPTVNDGEVGQTAQPAFAVSQSPAAMPATGGNIAPNGVAGPQPNLKAPHIMQ